MGLPDPADDATPDGSGTKSAAWILVALAVLSPWPFGSVGHLATAAISLVAGVVACITCLRLLGRGRSLPSAPFVWPLVAVLALGVIQLVPMPIGLQVALVPGPARVWHPVEPEAAEVLGRGPRPLSIHPSATRRVLAFAGSVIALGLVASSAFVRRRLTVQVSVAVAASGLAVSLFGIATHLMFGKLLYGQLAVPTVAPFGSYVSKNHFAGYVEMAALLTLGLAVGLADERRRGLSPLSWIENRSAWKVLLASGAAVTMCLAVLVSQSRGGAIALVFGLLRFVLLRMQRRERGSRRAAFGLGVGALLLAFLVLPRSSQERLWGLSRAGQDAAGAFRLATWNASVRATSASPFLGWGLGSFADALPAYKTSSGLLRVEHAENDYLELLTEGGLVGFGLAIAAIVLWARTLRNRGSAPRGGPLHESLSVGAESAAIALLTHGLFDFNFHIPSNALLFSLLVALQAGTRPRSPSTTSFPVGVVAVFSGVAIFLGGGLAPPPARPDLGSIRDRSAASLRLTQEESELVAHLRGRPADAEAWTLLGWLRGCAGDRAKGAALAVHGTRLDPEREQLRAIASALAGPEL